MITNIHESISAVEKQTFKCFYCGKHEDNLTQIVFHCSSKHENDVVKYLEYNHESRSYECKLHKGMVPSGSEIIVEDDVINDKYDSVLQRLNTSVKIGQSSNVVENTDTPVSFNDKPIDLDKALNEMQLMLPAILNTLFEQGKLESYLKFNRLIHDEKLPMDNICFLLFNDLIEWYSITNTSQMRYQKETVKFWQLGYRLFHGKFIRFMSGLKNYGQILDEEAKSGELTAESSRVNFAVPALNNLYKVDDRTAPIYPGILEKNIKLLATVYKSRPLKLCVDGKKISRGAGKIMGDIDCLGNEAKPSLCEKKSKSRTC